MELKDKKVLVIGLARTGEECARFLAHRGASVLVTDVRSEQELKQEMDALAELPIRYLLGAEDTSFLRDVDFVIPSPGVPAENLFIREANGRAIEILSEIELAYRFLRAPLIGVTGTNGKS